MTSVLPKTSERLLPERVASRDEHLQYLRHIFAYEQAPPMLDPGARVLDFGCGEGYGAGRLAGHGFEVVGVDVDPAVTAHAEAKYGSEQCRFECYSGRRLGFDDGAFDAVVSLQVLEHVEDGALYVEEAARVLRPEGRLILVTPNAATRLKPGARPWNRFHLHEYTADELRGLLQGTFADVTLAGVMATDDVYAIEMDRVRQARRMAAVDFLNVRRLIPESLKPWAARVAKRLFPRRDADRGSPEWQTRYGIDSYFLVEHEVERSLDLLATCRK